MEARNMELNEAAARTVRDESYGALVEEKWGRFLEGVKQPYVRRCMAMLYENQFASMRQRLTEDTLSTNAGEYTKYIFPLLRRVFPNLIANELVSVQPMTAPVGAIFFYEYKYGKSKGAVTANANLVESFHSHYSSEKVDGEQVATPNGVAYGGAGAALAFTTGYTPVRPLDADSGVSVLLQDLDADGTVVQEAIDDGAGGFTGDASAGAINYQTGAVTAFKFTTAPTAGAGRTIKITYFYDSESNNQIPDIYLDISLQPIRATTRKLKAKWSVEAADDLRAYQGVDAETDLVSGISQNVSLELDRDVLSQVRDASAGITATFDFTVPAGVSEIDHIRSVMTRMSNVSFKIFKKTLRAPANWAVTSPDIAAKLSQLMTHGDYLPAWFNINQGIGNSSYDGTVIPSSYGPISSHQGVMKMGPLNNKWMLYQDPFGKFNEIIMGFRGETYLDAGFVFAPYVPLSMTPTFLDPETQSYVKGVRTRYATKLLRPDWFGRVTITGGL